MCELTWWERLGLTAKEGHALEDIALRLAVCGIDVDPRDAAAALLGPSATDFAGRCKALEAALRREDVKMSDKVQFGSGLVGNKLIVHPNRVEIVSGCLPFRRRRIIPFSAIASVEVPQFLNVVVIHTNDGKAARYSVGNARKIQEAILERL